MSEPAKNTHVSQTYFFTSATETHPVGSSLQDFIFFIDPSEAFSLNVKGKAMGGTATDRSGAVTGYTLMSDGTYHNYGATTPFSAGNGVWGSVLSVQNYTNDTAYPLAVVFQFSGFIGCIEFQVWLT